MDRELGMHHGALKSRVANKQGQRLSIAMIDWCTLRQWACSLLQEWRINHRWSVSTKYKAALPGFFICLAAGSGEPPSWQPAALSRHQCPSPVKSGVTNGTLSISASSFLPRPGRRARHFGTIQKNLDAHLGRRTGVWWRSSRWLHIIRDWNIQLWKRTGRQTTQS